MMVTAIEPREGGKENPMQIIINETAQGEFKRGAHSLINIIHRARLISNQDQIHANARIEDMATEYECRRFPGGSIKYIPGNLVDGKMSKIQICLFAEIGRPTQRFLEETADTIAPAIDMAKAALGMGKMVFKSIRDSYRRAHDEWEAKFEYGYRVVFVDHWNDLHVCAGALVQEDCFGQRSIKEIRWARHSNTIVELVEAAVKSHDYACDVLHTDRNNAISMIETFLAAKDDEHYPRSQDSNETGVEEPQVVESGYVGFIERFIGFVVDEHEWQPESGQRRIRIGTYGSVLEDPIYRNEWTVDESRYEALVGFLAEKNINIKNGEARIFVNAEDEERSSLRKVKNLYTEVYRKIGEMCDEELEEICRF